MLINFSISLTIAKRCQDRSKFLLNQFRIRIKLQYKRIPKSHALLCLESLWLSPSLVRLQAKYLYLSDPSFEILHTPCSPLTNPHKQARHQRDPSLAWQNVML